MKTSWDFAPVALAACLTLVLAGPALAGDLEVEVDTGTGLTLGPEGPQVDTGGSVPLEFIQQGLESRPEKEFRPLGEMLQQPAYDDAPPESPEDMELEIERERVKARALEEELERLRGEGQ
jgi:hypothetical protein